MTEEITKIKFAGRKWKRIIIFIVAISLIVLIVPPVLNKIAESKVKEQLEKLAPLATVKYSSIYTDLFASSLSINDLSVKFQPDSSNSNHHSFYFSKVDFTGMNFLKALVSKELLIDELKLEKGAVLFDQFLLDKKDSAVYELMSRMPFKEISINHLETDETNVWTHSGGENKLLLRGQMNIDNIDINNTQQSYTSNSLHFGAVQCNITDVNYSVPSLHQTLQVKQLLLDSRKGILRIDSLKITPGAVNNAAKHQAFISSIELSKFDALKLKDKQLVAGTILINKCDADVFNTNSIQRDTENEKSSAIDINQILNEVKIDSLIIENSSLKLEGAFANNFKSYQEDIGLKNFSVNHLLVAETNVKLNSENQCKIKTIEITGLNKHFNSSINYSSIELNVSNISYSIPHAYRTVQIKNVTANSKEKLVKIEGLKISTQYSKYECGRRLGRQADYIEASVPFTEISGLNFKQLSQKRVVADKIMIDECKLYFFRDRRLPRELKEQPMPNGYLNQIPIEVRVNKFEIKNASILSEEFPKVGDQAGYLAINKVNVSMSPMLNHPTENDPTYSDTYVEASIMNAGFIQANIHAPLRKNIYFIKGVIKDLDLPKLNPSAENLGRFHIESGVLNFLDFHFTATEKKASGEIIGEYHDLIIDRLKPKNNEKEVAKMPTFFLKHVIIRKNKDKSLDVKKRTGEIDYKRDPTRLVTFYFLKSLLSGIRASFTLGFLLPE
jgi:hypothetical protein